jgi:carbamate kinase
MTDSQGTVVVAVGGNSLIKDATHIALSDQIEAATETLRHVATMLAEGWKVVVTHGNGPQVGFLLRRAELASAELPTIPLDVLGADTQGATGYMFTQILANECRRAGLSASPVSIVTQTQVSPDDPAFGAPSKPIGSFMDEPTARRREAEDGWAVVEDAGRGYRRVVASPQPVRIVELDAIRELVDAGHTVIAGGGGGVPVVQDADGSLRGVEAVIDKDLATALLAGQLGADVLMISTAVDAVAVDFNKPTQRWLDTVTADEAREYVAAGQFGKGSMEPKVAAALSFLDNGGSKVIITSPEKMRDALDGKAGTTIIP